MQIDTKFIPSTSTSALTVSEAGLKSINPYPAECNYCSMVALNLHKFYTHCDNYVELNIKFPRKQSN